MADYITPVFDILTCLCGYCSKWADSIRSLGDNLESLKKASNELSNMHLDVKMKVETEINRDREMMVLNVVTGWMGRVEGLQNEVEDILKEGDQELRAVCFGGRCPKHCRGRYKLNKRVTKKLSDVNDLKSKGHFDVVAERFARDEFHELPVDKTVGTELKFAELRSCFQDNKVGIIGLYGMGGVGKTTLLKKFHNEFLSAKRDYEAIWVVASKDADPGKIQNDIMEKLGIKVDDSNDKEKDDRRVSLLYNGLKKRKFVLLLDDVWGRIDLLKLGVPFPNSHECKIIFTTRLYEVCGLMETKRCIKVNCLTPNQAFDLFKEKVGEATLENPLILPLAEQVVNECQGLPLALCTVGRAMANKETPDEWKRVLEILSSYPSKMQGIVEDVFYLLEFSYDILPNDAYKSCFLYCALFPDDYNIQKEELILLWIAEGFLAEFDYDIHEARKQGEDIISGLKYACLLEGGWLKNTVKMHDVIRDMALWIACDHGKKTRFFVNDSSNTGTLLVYKHAKWEEVVKLSLRGNRELISNYFSQKTYCPNLVTMLTRNVLIPSVFPTEIFVLPTTIRVLDLSGSGSVLDLPPTIGDFVNLEHLNLSYTFIINLPDEVKNLKKLRFLLLDGLRDLVLPQNVVSSLLSLQAFSMRENSVSGIHENALLHELEGLDHLQDTRICVSSLSSIKKILNSSKLQRSMCELIVQKLSLPHDLFLALGKMKHLEAFLVDGNTSKPATKAADILMVRSSFWKHAHIIPMLRYLSLKEYHNVIDLNWLIHASNLEVLELAKCDLLEEVISEDTGKNNLFSNLTYLHLIDLRNLKSICRMEFQFASLKVIQVSYCPKVL